MSINELVEAGFRLLGTSKNPSFLQFETSTICNSRCIFCPFDKMKKRPTASWSQLNKVIEECTPLVKAVCSFLMQEPFLEPRLVGLLNYIKQTNMRADTIIFSNMGAVMDKMLKRIVDNQTLDQIVISFYGPTEELYNKYQRGLSWDRTRANIISLFKYREERGLLLPEIRMHYLATEELLDHYERFVGEWSPYCDSVGTVYYDTFHGEAPDLGDNDRFFGAPYPKRVPCSKLWKDYNVLSNGHVVPCCYDKDTQIFTNEGWKFFKELNGEEEIYTLNPENKQIELHKALNKISYKYEGKMVHFKNTGLDIMVTPNHKMYVKKEKQKSNTEYELISADKLIGHNQLFRFLQTANWDKNDPEIIEEFGEKIVLSDFLELLGYYLADGAKHSKDTITIWQHRGEKQDKYFNAIKKLGICNPWRDDKRVMFSHKGLYNYLQKLGTSHHKYIPQEFLNLGKRNLIILFNALMLGDGDKVGINYYTSSRKLAEQMVELCIKIGYSAKIAVHYEKGNIQYEKGYDKPFISRETNWVVRIKKKLLHPFIKGKNIKIIDYNDMIYCVEVPNHIIYVRRNNQHPVWCGNCLDFNDEQRLGNAYLQKPEEIWRNKWYDYMRRQHVEGKQDEIPLCRNCTYWRHEESRGWVDWWIKQLKC